MGNISNMRRKGEWESRREEEGLLRSGARQDRACRGKYKKEKAMGAGRIGQKGVAATGELANGTTSFFCLSSVLLLAHLFFLSQSMRVVSCLYSLLLLTKEDKKKHDNT